MKNNLLIVSFIFSFILLVVFIGCSKSSSSSSSPSARTVLLTKAAWRLDSAGVDLNKDGIIDYADSTIQACDKDNTYLFKTDSTGVMDEGPTKCNPGNPQTATFNWSLSSNQNVLNGTFSSSLAGGVNIFSMTDTKMVLYKDTAYLGQSFWYVLYMKH